MANSTAVVNTIARNAKTEVFSELRWFSFLGFSLILITKNAFAESNGGATNVQLGANYFEGIASNYLPGGLLTFFIGLVIVVIFLIILGSWRPRSGYNDTKLRTLADGPSAHNLFLGMKFRSLLAQDASQPVTSEVGYLRSLGVTSASFVAPKPIDKSSRVRLFLGSLPGFPTENLTVDGSVYRCRPLGGEPASFMVYVRFGHLTDATREPLSTYLASLAHRSSALSHG